MVGLEEGLQLELQQEEEQWQGQEREREREGVQELLLVLQEELQLAVEPVQVQLA